MRDKSFKAQPPALVVVEAHCLSPLLRMKRPMHCHKMVVNANLYGKRLEVFEVFATEVPACPADRFCRSVVKPFHRKLSSDGPVVIARHTQYI
jgi:hypothetical protein